jgi:hypothetical protein
MSLNGSPTASSLLKALRMIAWLRDSVVWRSTFTISAAVSTSTVTARASVIEAMGRPFSSPLGLTVYALPVVGGKSEVTIVMAEDTGSSSTRSVRRQTRASRLSDIS